MQQCKRQTSSLSQGADRLAAVSGKRIGNSLVAQWLGLYAFTAKGTGWILSQGTRIPQAAQYGKKNIKTIQINKNPSSYPGSSKQCRMVRDYWAQIQRRDEAGQHLPQQPWVSVPRSFQEIHYTGKTSHMRGSPSWLCLRTTLSTS